VTDEEITKEQGVAMKDRNIQVRNLGKRLRQVRYESCNEGKERDMRSRGILRSVEW
jgi:hypothetical protein